MQYTKIDMSKDIPAIQEVVSSAFSSSSDSIIKEWFSFPVMQEKIANSRGGASRLSIKRVIF